MADLAGITAVRTTGNTRIEDDVTYGATISAGNALYKDTDSKWKLADADASISAAAARGIAVTPGVDDGAGIVATSGGVVLVGTTMVVGTMYVVSDTPGGIKPDADLATGDYATNIGRASTATQLEIAFEATGIQVP